MLSTIIYLLGAITSIGLTHRIYNFINLYFFYESKLPQYLHPGKNSYALVTGASDGIGLATAKALQKHGFNVILHGRNPEKLADLSKTLSQEFPNVHTVIVAADASDAVPAVSKVAKAVEEVEKSGGKLTVLVNNVGGMSFGSSPYLPLADIPMDTVSKIVDVNMRFPTMLTRALLPTIIANKPGLVINIGSFAGCYGMANLSLYAPSKAFNHNFSKSLSAELKLAKISVEVLGIVVGEVQTSGNPDAAPGFATLTPDQMAKDLLGKVGCGKSLVVGSWKQCLLGQMITFFPEQMAESVMSAAMSKRIEKELKKS